MRVALLPLCFALVVALPAPGEEPVAAPPDERLVPVAARPPHTDAAPRGPGVEERLAEIASRVQHASRYPAIAQARGASGEAVVGFEIGPDGAPRDLALAETSGSGALDRAALSAVADAAPLPFVFGRIQVPVRFALDSTP